MSEKTRGQIFLARVLHNVADWANVNSLAASTKSLPHGRYPAYTPQEDMKPFAWGHKLDNTAMRNIFATVFR